MDFTLQKHLYVPSVYASELIAYTNAVRRQKMVVKQINRDIVSIQSQLGDINATQKQLRHSAWSEKFIEVASAMLSPKQFEELKRKTNKEVDKWLALDAETKS